MHAAVVDAHAAMVVTRRYRSGGTATSL